MEDWKDGRLDSEAWNKASVAAIDLEMRSLGAVLADERFVCPGQGMVYKVGVFLGFRGCEGPQPSWSGTTMKALITNLEGVRFLGAVLADKPLSARDGIWYSTLGSFLVPRLRGTAALQVRNDYAENL